MSDIPYWYRVYAEDPTLRKVGARFRFVVKDFNQAILTLVVMDLSVKRMNGILRKDDLTREQAGIVRFLRLWHGIEFLPVFWTAPRTCLDGVEHVVGTVADLFLGVRLQDCPDAKSVRLKCDASNSWIDFELDRTGCAYFAPIVMRNLWYTRYTATAIDGQGQCVPSACSVLAAVVETDVHNQLPNIMMRALTSA